MPSDLNSCCISRLFLPFAWSLQIRSASSVSGFRPRLHAGKSERAMCFSCFRYSRQRKGMSCSSASYRSLMAMSSSRLLTQAARCSFATSISLREALADSWLIQAGLKGPSCFSHFLRHSGRLSRKDCNCCSGECTGHLPRGIPNRRQSASGPGCARRFGSDPSRHLQFTENG